MRDGGLIISSWIQEHDSVLRDWNAIKGEYVAEVLRLHGLCGSSTGICKACKTSGENVARFRCDDCLGTSVLCRGCCVTAHRAAPFHTIKVRSVLSIVKLS